MSLSHSFLYHFILSPSLPWPLFHLFFLSLFLFSFSCASSSLICRAMKMLSFILLPQNGRTKGGRLGECCHMLSLRFANNFLHLYRSLLKEMYNPHFGSIFRTEKAPTYFSRRLNRFANLYMPSLESLQGYHLDHTFYPRRLALPHETDLNFDLTD